MTVALHRDVHPAPEPGCFGCKVLQVGYQGLQSQHGPNPVQRIPVVAERGPRRGQVTAEHRLHWTGRQDAIVRPTPVRLSASTPSPAEGDR